MTRPVPMGSAFLNRWRPAPGLGSSAWMGQAPPAQPVSTTPAAALSAETARAARNKTFALIAAGVGTVGGGTAAYSHYIRSGRKMNNWAVAGIVFAAVNLAVFGLVLSEG